MFLKSFSNFVKVKMVYNMIYLTILLYSNTCKQQEAKMTKHHLMFIIMQHIRVHHYGIDQTKQHVLIVKVYGLLGDKHTSLHIRFGQSGYI